MGTLTLVTPSSSSEESKSEPEADAMRTRPGATLTESVFSGGGGALEPVVTRGPCLGQTNKYPKAAIPGPVIKHTASKVKC